MKASRIVMSALGMVVMASIAAFSAVPGMVNYQGYLKNADGTPVNSAVSVRFSLYSSTRAGSGPVWRETKSVTPSNGIYSTQLGSTTPITAPFDVPYWLGVKVAGDAEMQLLALASAPYAWRAAMADVVATGGVTTATLADSSVTTPKIAAGAVTDSQISGTISAAKLDLSGVQQKYAKVAVVAKSGGDYSDPVTAMSGVANWCGTPSATNTCLLKIMPGVYDLGSGTLAMQQFVDIEGSGELSTTITSAISAEPNGTVGGASNSELRYLAVRNTAPHTLGVWGIGIANVGSSPKISHVTVSTSVASISCGIYNSSAAAPIISDVTTTAAGVNGSYGIANKAAEPTLINVTTSALGVTSSNYGILNSSSSPRLVNVIATASGGPSFNHGMFNTAASGTYTINIDRSTFEGSSSSISGTSAGYTLRIGASKLVGPVGPVGTYIYSGMYDDNGTVTANAFSGNGSGLTNVAATSVSNGVYTIGSYADPAWLTSLTAAKITGILPIANGGTGSATQNYVDLSSAQTIGGAKAFTTDIRTPILYDQNNTAYYLDPASTSNLYAVNLAGFANVAAGSHYKYNNQNVITADTDRNNYYFGSAGNLTATGVGNIAIGTSALSLNTTGYSNTATGSSALGINSSGFLNTATGVSSLYSNTSGQENTACGASALGLNTTGDFNTATGRSALLSNSDGNNNTANGKDALYYNTTGNYNTALGARAGVTGTFTNANTTGSNNTFIGYNSGPGTTAQLTNATAIGANALVSTSNSIVLGGTGVDAVNVGIGSTAPMAKVTIVNSSAATKGVTVQAAASQTANLQEWQNSAGTAVASVSPSGVFSGNGSGLSGLDATNVSSGVLPIARGGTGSATQNFVDLTSTQGSIGGNKTFTGSVAAVQLTSTGNIDLPATSATAGQIRQGGNRFIHSYGNNNFFAGTNAGGLITVGSNNTASGYSALYSNTSGTYNTAFGTFALYSSTNSRANTAIGMDALYANISGDNNTAIGALALESNTTGNNNTAIGIVALEANTTGNDNTASGSSALMNNTTANRNTAIGSQAMFTQSYDNGGTNWDSYNTAVGYQALYKNQPNSTSNGNYNAALGSFALTENTTGYNNVAFGADSLKNNTSGISNSAVGYAALFWNTTGNRNTAVGRDAGLAVSTGSDITLLGYGTNVSSGNLTNATAIGSGATVNAPNKVRIGNGSVNVIEGQVGWSFPSDFRLKEDVREIGKGLDFIAALRPVEYRLKNGNGRTDFGFIAQDVETLLGSDYNLLGIGEDADRTLSLRYTDFIAPMVKAMQEQQALIEAQGSMIKELKAELETLKQTVGAK